MTSPAPFRDPSAPRISVGSGILLVGGYGMVGRRIAARLIGSFPDRVVIAGRDEQRTHFPPPIGPRTAYLFPWPEVFGDQDPPAV